MTLFKSNTKSLTDEKYNLAVNMRLSGLPYSKIAETIGANPKTTQANISKAPELAYFLNPTDKELALVNEQVGLIAEQVVVYDLAVTGDIADGILYTDNITELSTIDNQINVIDAVFKSNKYESADLSIPTKTLVVGFIKPIKDLTDAQNAGLIDLLYLSNDTDSIQALIEEHKLDVAYVADSKYLYIIQPEDIDYVESIEEIEDPVEYVWQASSSFLTIHDGEKSYNCDSSHPNFKKAIQALIEGEYKTAIELANVKLAVLEYTKGYINIKNGELTYQGYPIRNGLVTRIIDSMQQGKEFEDYLNFLNNLMLNPSNSAIMRLYDFLVATDIEITEDGHFIAWKVITGDYKDCYTRKIDNSIGTTVTMPRAFVNTNDEQTCSSGLHVCSKSYIKHFTNSSCRLVKVKVNPRDVVSIPVDYNDAKMRVCEYVVIEEVITE